MMQDFDEFFRAATGHCRMGTRSGSPTAGCPLWCRSLPGPARPALSWPGCGDGCMRPDRGSACRGGWYMRCRSGAWSSRSRARPGAGWRTSGWPIEVALHVVMGGAGESQRQWRLDMHRPAIVVGTVDSLVSKALNRGYGIGAGDLPDRLRAGHQRRALGDRRDPALRGVDDHVAAACRVREDVRHGGAVRADLHVGHRAGRAAGDRGQSGARRRGRDLAGGACRGAGPAPGRRSGRSGGWPPGRATTRRSPRRPGTGTGQAR